MSIEALGVRNDLNKCFLYELNIRP